MEKTFAQGVEATADVSTTTITQDETSMAVAKLTSMLDNSQSTSPTSNGAYDNVRPNEIDSFADHSFYCLIFHSIGG